MSLGSLFANYADPEVERSPEDAALSKRVFDRMVEQVKAGVKPWEVTPPHGVTAERSRELLKGTGIHGALKAEWDKKQSLLPGASRRSYDGHSPSLPEPHWWSFAKR